MTEVDVSRNILRVTLGIILGMIIARVILNYASPLNPSIYKEIKNRNLMATAVAIRKDPPNYQVIFGERPNFQRLTRASVIIEVAWYLPNQKICNFSGTGLVIKNSDHKLMVLTAKHMIERESIIDVCADALEEPSHIGLISKYPTGIKPEYTGFLRNQIIFGKFPENDLLIFGVRLPDDEERLPLWQEYPDLCWGCKPDPSDRLSGIVFQSAFEDAGAYMGFPAVFQLRSDAFGTPLIDQPSLTNKPEYLIDQSIFNGSSGTALINGSGKVVAVGTRTGMYLTGDQFSSVNFLPEDNSPLRYVESQINK